MDYSRLTSSQIFIRSSSIRVSALSARDYLSSALVICQQPLFWTLDFLIDSLFQAYALVSALQPGRGSLLCNDLLKSFRLVQNNIHTLSSLSL
ncbi:hypothetical protein CY34DRAFT_157738 [Suillus luteus UH-Slu-Lm8-n1]|uniref:Uncharacterized protein n=1 Tax=Suillus luteus UH-Slu-Lm8-n1 TaxID=930992 RepID=A0A0D0B6T0_9AGAM|nr:hypothetical protein CY34DRAFT_157738 [Suillus luteus UH-Slu-Lm8-n1]